MNESHYCQILLLQQDASSKKQKIPAHFCYQIWRQDCMARGPALVHNHTSTQTGMRMQERYMISSQDGNKHLQSQMQPSVTCFWVMWHHMTIRAVASYRCHVIDNYMARAAHFYLRQTKEVRRYHLWTSHPLSVGQRKTILPLYWVLTSQHIWQFTRFYLVSKIA